MELAGCFDGACFADDADFDAARVCEFLFDASCDVAADDGCFFVVDDVGFDEYADFAAGLDGVAFFDAFEGEADFFDVFESFDVCFEDFASCTGSSA